MKKMKEDKILHFKQFIICFNRGGLSCLPGGVAGKRMCVKSEIKKTADQIDGLSNLALDLMVDTMHPFPIPGALHKTQSIYH